MPSTDFSSRSDLPVGALLRGEVGAISAWIRRWNRTAAATQCAQICLGAGLFGAAMGYWRSPLQAVFGAIKLPLILLLTGVGNALINAMLAPLLGVPFSLRQSLAAVLTSFALASIILGGVSPVIAFLVWNLPPLTSGHAHAGFAHSLLLFALICAVGLAGGAANLRLFQTLRTRTEKASSAQHVLFSWLAINLLLGSQLSWLLRPYVGSPDLPVVFVRPEAMHGSFFSLVGDLLKGLL